MTLDDVISSVKYNNVSLKVRGNLRKWNSEKYFSFEALNDIPGFLEITGRDNNPHQNCEKGGLLMYCWANDSSSPWHKFVSDNVNWKDEFNNEPCARSQSGIMLLNDPIIKFFKSVGAKKIWANRQNAILRGKPRS